MFNKINKLQLILAVLLTLFTVTLLHPPSTKAEILFQDDFNDNDINNKWIIKNYTHEVLGSFSPWTQLNLLENNQHITISGYDILSDKNYNGKVVGWFGKSLITLSKYQLEKILFLETKVNLFDFNTGSNAVLTFEFDENNRIIFNIGDRPIYETGFKASQLAFDENGVSRCVGSKLENENQTGCVLIPMNLDKNTVYDLKIEFNNTSKIVKGYINNIPVHIGTFKGNVSDFHVGIAASVRDTGNYIDARFDDFKLYSGAPEIILNVTDIKQFAPEWGWREYDSAKKWYPTNPTISRWGCALTSASMLLKYYGHDINPDALNEWLIAQKDGYTRNGGIMWPTVSRMTQYRYLADHDLPILEFAYLTYSENKLKDEIENERPGILKLAKSSSTHFIVGKGYNDSDILINDPGKDGHTTLAQANSYWGSTSKIGRFKKSETDLSYIVLYIDDGFDIEVSNNQGIIEGEEYYFKEYPMSDPDNPNLESGVETLNAFYYPKPESDEYKVKINGEDVYRVDYYIYDETGESKIGYSFSSLNANEEDEYIIDFNKFDIEDTLVPQITYESVLSYWETLYKNEDITNQGLYLSVKQLLENSFKNSNKNYSSEILLNNILHIIYNHGNQETGKNALDYFKFQIEELLSRITP